MVIVVGGNLAAPALKYEIKLARQPRSFDPWFVWPSGESAQYSTLRICSAMRIISEEAHAKANPRAAAGGRGRLSGSRREDHY